MAKLPKVMIIVFDATERLLIVNALALKVHIIGEAGSGTYSVDVFRRLRRLSATPDYFVIDGRETTVEWLKNNDLGDDIKAVPVVALDTEAGHDVLAQFEEATHKEPTPIAGPVALNKLREQIAGGG